MATSCCKSARWPLQLQRIARGRCTLLVKAAAAPPFGTSNSPAANSSPSSSNWIPDMHGRCRHRTDWSGPGSSPRLSGVRARAAWRSRCCRGDRPDARRGMAERPVQQLEQRLLQQPAGPRIGCLRPSTADLLGTGGGPSSSPQCIGCISTSCCRCAGAKWMTDKLLGRWLEGGTQYRLRFADGGSPDNPDQRIAEDVRLFVSSTPRTQPGLLNRWSPWCPSPASCGRFPATMCCRSAMGIRIPGFMLWAALLYSVAGSWLIHRLGCPLTWLNAEQQRREADFRFGWCGRASTARRSRCRARGGRTGAAQGRLRSAAGQLAGVGAAHQAPDLVLLRLRPVGGRLPFLAARRAISRGIELGGLMQTAQAFDRCRVPPAGSWTPMPASPNGSRPSTA